MQSANMTAPVYRGYEGGGKKKDSGKKNAQYDDKTKRLLRQMGAETEEDELFWPLIGGPAAYGQGDLENSIGASPYNAMMPIGRGMQQYAPMTMPQNARQPNMQRPGMQGEASQINIQYTAPDGTTYNMSVVTPQENRGKALYNVMCGLYGLMMAEGESGQYGKAGGKAGSKGGGPGYAGGKGGK